MNEPDILFEAMEIAAAAEAASAADGYGLPECRDDLRFYSDWIKATKPTKVEWAMVPVAVETVLDAEPIEDVQEALSFFIGTYVGAVTYRGGTYGGAAVALHDSVDAMRAHGRTGFAEALHVLLCRGSCWGRKKQAV